MLNKDVCVAHFLRDFFGLNFNYCVILMTLVLCAMDCFQDILARLHPSYCKIHECAKLDVNNIIIIVSSRYADVNDRWLDFKQK